MNMEYGPVVAVVQKASYGFIWLVVAISGVAALALVAARMQHRRFTLIQWVNVFWFVAPLVFITLIYWIASGISTPAL
jgi:hypothetical protein